MASVLVVRTFDNFSRILTENGFSVINCPTIETVPHENLSGLGAKIFVENYDGIFLTSRRATEIFCRELIDKNIKYGGKIYILGQSSFELLKDKNLDLFFTDAANTAQEMLNSIPLQDLESKRFLFVRGEKSLRTVPEFLEKTATVDEIIVYKTLKIAVENNQIKKLEVKSKNREIICACFFSPSGAESFLEQFSACFFHQIKIAAIGKTTADFFAKQNLEIDFTPTKANSEDFAFELINYLGRNYPPGG